MRIPAVLLWARAIPIWVYAAIIALGVIGWQRVEVSHYKAQLAAVTAKHAVEATHIAELATKASEAARAAEHGQAQAFNAIAARYEQDKTDALTAQAGVIADLRAGNLRLRDRWATQSLATQVAASAGKPDAAAADREASAGRIVRAARDADDQIRELQAVLMAERQ